MKRSTTATRRTALGWSLAALAGLGSLTRSVAQPAPRADVATLLDQAIAGPQRSAANKARDTFRHPKETLLFFGLAPDQTVIEIAPGGGWYTEILAPVLHDRGRFLAAHYALNSTSTEQRNARVRFDEKMAREPSFYGKVVVGTMPVDRFVDIDPPGGADMVLTFRNIHNWIQEGRLDAMLAAFNKVLKPGGVLGVEEHRAPPGTTLERTIATGYVTEALVVERCKTAGFTLAGDSEINANPRDTKDYPNGVWSLPPTLRGGDVDKARYTAIGESDRMTLKFVKPAR